jgi:nucleoid DNA-binding protein
MHKPPTLTKQQIIRSIGRHTGVRDSEVAVVIESLIQVLTDQLAAGGRVEIQNFLVMEIQTYRRQPPQASVGTSIPPPITYHSLKVRPGKKLRSYLKTIQR